MSGDPRDEAFRDLLEAVRRFNRRPTISRREEVEKAAVLLVHAHYPQYEREST